MPEFVDEGGGVMNVAVERPSTTSVADSAPAARDRSARWAAWTFAAVAAVAVPVILYQGRDQWFFNDEWDFLARRSAGSLHDLMTPHAQHWMTFGILVYRALWRLVGLNHYWPYQLCIVTAHVAVAVLLRAVMRRAQVNPWVATAAASLFLVFGTGRDNIVWAFQITFTSAVAFGLAHLLLADHDGPFDRRDLIGIGFGVVALMCSAIGVAMAVAVGMATLLRRGWRMAMVHTAPLAAVFVLWWATFGRDAYDGPKADLATIMAFVRDQVAAVFSALGQLRGVGVLLALAVVVGVPLAIRRQTWAQFRRCGSPTVGLAVAAVGFAVNTGYGRAAGPYAGTPAISPDASRYVYVAAALLLPIVAVAVSAFVDRWRIALPFAVAIFLVGIPQNVGKLHASRAEAAILGDPNLVLTMAHMPLARDVPRDLYPFESPGLRRVSIGWFVDGVSSGRVPEPARVDPATIATAELLLAVQQTNDVPNGLCAPIPSGDVLHVVPGDVIKTNSLGVTLQSRIDGGSPAQVTYSGNFGTSLRIVGGPLDVVVQPLPADAPAELCR